MTPEKIRRDVDFVCMTPARSAHEKRHFPGRAVDTWGGRRAENFEANLSAGILAKEKRPTSTLR